MSEFQRCALMVHLYVQLLNPIHSWMSADGHHATASSPLEAAQHIAGDNYLGPITAIGGTVVVGGCGDTYVMGQGRLPSLSRFHDLDI